MNKPPILPGMRAFDSEGGSWSIGHAKFGNASHDAASTDRRWGPFTPDYTDPATCGALMAWCHRELEQAIAATHKPLRPRFNAARVALSEARPWDSDSVRRAVEAVCEVLP